jgi:hypothetical protein
MIGSQGRLPGRRGNEGNSGTAASSPYRVGYFTHKKPEQEDEIVATRLDQWRTNMQATVARIRTIAETR